MRLPLSAVIAVSVLTPAFFVAPAGAEEPVIEAAPGIMIVDTIDGVVDVTGEDALDYVAELQATQPIDPQANEIVGSAALRTANAVATGFSVDYNGTEPPNPYDSGPPPYSYPAPAEVRALVNSAVANWNSVLATSTGPIEIEFYWECLDPRLLGLAGPADFYRHTDLPTSDWYPAALANTLLGYDMNGTTQPEIRVGINAALAAGNDCEEPGGVWHLDTSGNPTGSQIDLYSVILHELGHGLGFLGSASGSAFPPDGLNVFDRRVLYGGSPLLNQPDPNSKLTSGALSLDVGSGWSYEAFAPSSWLQGSSLSHFDETASPAGAPGALMTPRLGQNEAERTIDAPTVGLMREIGWPVKVRAASPQKLTSTVSGSNVTASWTIGMTTKGLPPSSHVVELYADGVLRSSKTVSGKSTSATVAGYVAGKNHTLVVTPVGPGGAGTPASLASKAPAPLTAAGSLAARDLSWPLAAGSAPVSSYTVQQQINSGSWVTIANPTGQTASTSGLPDGSIVQFRVRANTSLGTSEWTYSTLIGVSTTVVRPFPLDGQVGRLYLAYFQRTADKAGFSHWLTQRANGLDVNAISAAFADSQEFQNTYGSLTNGSFVDLIYRNVLDRAPDAEGRAFWTSALDKGLSRGAVMVAFADSQEFITKTRTTAPTSSAEGQIYRLYVAFFLRAPDKGGQDFWTGMRISGTSLDDIAGEFVSSTEFKNRYGSLSNEAFVELVYLNVLGRTPDAAGLSYWNALLDKGRSRGSVMTGFSESVEFILLTGSLP